MSCARKSINLIMLALIAIVGVAMLVPPNAWAGGPTVYVPPPNNTDDTANLQSALDTCISHGPGCTVQLASGRYLTKQIVAFNFRGTFKGKGKGRTIIEALPNLPVTATSDEDPPDTTDHTWPMLIMFVDGDIHVSDLTIRITAVPATQPFPLPDGNEYRQLMGAIQIMGQNRTNAAIERVSIEGAPDETSWWGSNLINGVYWEANLPMPPDFHEAYPLSGTLSIKSCTFKHALAGAGIGGGGAVLKDSRFVIGGSPGAGNTFEDIGWGIDLESIENSVVEASYNNASTYIAGLDVLQVQTTPARPSLFLIHHNTFKPAGPFANGIVLSDDSANKWIYALIYNNTIEAQDVGYAGITAYGTKGTTMANNKISGTGAMAIYIGNSTYASSLANDVTGFVPNPEFGYSQIVLDETTNHSTVVCRTRNDTVQNMGTDNKVLGCN